MDLEKFTQEPYLGNPDFYRQLIGKLGGPETVRPFIPFDMPVLQKSYAEDKNFNTKLTPLRVWDKATGIWVQEGQTTRPPIHTGTGLAGWLHRKHHIVLISQSECVCILKIAAEMLVTQANSTPERS